jgi:hypothetical protein
LVTINKEKEHWRGFLTHVVVVVQYIATYCLAFLGTSSRLYEEGKGNFLDLIATLVNFDSTMHGHVRLFVSEDLHDRLDHRMQNELRSVVAFNV